MVRVAWLACVALLCSTSALSQERGTQDRHEALLSAGPIGYTVDDGECALWPAGRRLIIVGRSSRRNCEAFISAITGRHVFHLSPRRFYQAPPRRVVVECQHSRFGGNSWCVWSIDGTRMDWPYGFGESVVLFIDLTGKPWKQE